MNLQLMPKRARAALGATFGGAMLWLAGCTGTHSAAPITMPVPGQLSQVVATVRAEASSACQPAPSHAATARDYRHDAARHVYCGNKERIYGGKLPALLYAIGTLQVDLAANGKVASMHWLRAPKHAPEVIKEIERTVLEASPFPAPIRLGKVTWTDTWLWDKSGRFQLDTLGEGQL